MTDGDTVIENENAKPDEIEEVSQKNSADDVGRPAAKGNTLEIAEHQRDVPHGDRAANPVAAGRDEHAEIRRKHQAQLRRGGREVDQRGKGTRDMGGDVLQRDIDHAAGEHGHGLREQQQPQGKPGPATNARAGKQENNAAAIKKDGQGQRDERDQSPAGSDEEQRVFADQAEGEGKCDHQLGPTRFRASASGFVSTRGG